MTLGGWGLEVLGGGEWEWVGEGVEGGGSSEVSSIVALVQIWRFSKAYMTFNLYQRIYNLVFFIWVFTRPLKA